MGLTDLCVRVASVSDPGRAQDVTMLLDTGALYSVVPSVAGRRAASTVIFGQARDSALLGAVTLDELGLMLDPLRRDLKPLHLRLGALALTS